mgnify:CR=1 FL=1
MRGYNTSTKKIAPPSRNTTRGPQDAPGAILAGKTYHATRNGAAWNWSECGGMGTPSHTGAGEAEKGRYPHPRGLALCELRLDLGAMRAL